jgi:hypothetical protein
MWDLRARGHRLPTFRSRSRLVFWGLTRFDGHPPTDRIEADRAAMLALPPVAPVTGLA